MLSIIEEAREMKSDYTTFASQMEAVVRYNKGTSYENILRKIYIKYVYKGNTDTSRARNLYNDVFELLSNASSEYELQDIENEINDLSVRNKINEQEYNYLMSEVNNKRKEL